MDAERLKTIRGDYDLIAHDYAVHIGDELAAKPFDREILARFASAVSGRVCELGCGPGHVSRFLRDLGVNVFGLDLSPQMVEQARRLNADIEFCVGDMLALQLSDHSLAGIVSFYSIVNFPRESLPAAFAEMHRVLQPEGLLLLAFHTGDELLRPAEEWGHPITMEFFYHPPLKIQQLLREAGFAIDEMLERGPYAPEIEYQSHRAYILAHKPKPIGEASQTDGPR
jgi:ubiquinone/menaquinone biosynthesis C-methylase UbiE